jgi:hypothetical protein
MRGDFTRNTFDPSLHYSRVLMQQGRVQLDADWNEQGAIFTHFLRALARDLIGPYGAPAGSAGFQIVVDPNQIARFDGSPLGKSADPDDKALFKRLSDVLTGASTTFVINAGTYYVEGIRVENRQPMLYSDQTAFDSASFGAADKATNLVYLDVWERHVTCVEDPHIREVALGGPDTTTRAQIVWQVRSGPASRAARNPCDISGIPPRPGTGRLRAYAGPGAVPPSPCVIAPSSSYRGPENQLYRVEIHDPGVAGKATFKWSRENGSVVFPIVGKPQTSTGTSGGTTVSLTVATLGRDDKFGLHVGDWVELVDDAYVLQNRADALLQVTGIAKDQMQVTLASAGTISIAADAVQSNLLLRRWDQGSAPITVAETTAGGADYSKWFALEDGIVVTFVDAGDAKKPATYFTGDYWLIPARVATGNIDWPQTDGANPVPAALPPDGPKHHYAPLCVYHAGDGPNSPPSVGGCECKVQPLAVCGTGQPDANPQPVAPGAPARTKRGGR